MKRLRSLDEDRTRLRILRCGSWSARTHSLTGKLTLEGLIIEVVKISLPGVEILHGDAWNNGGGGFGKPDENLGQIVVAWLP